MTRRSLAAEPLNQPGPSRTNGTDKGAPASPALKRPFSPDYSAHDSDEENYEPAPGPRYKARKRVRRPAPGSSSFQKKRARIQSPARASTPDPSLDDDAPTHPNRTFPVTIPLHGAFPLFYRRFHVSSVIDTDLAAAHKFSGPKVPDGVPNPPRDGFDLYTPRFVKGRGTSKVGICPICHEGIERGGEGKKLWLSMKFSAFNYHMQYAHGISPATGRPFSPPVAFRVTARANPGKHEKTQMMEGKCHKCKKWIAVEGIKDVPTKVSRAFPLFRGTTGSLSAMIQVKEIFW
ncbi:hypothetical protein BD413DRAFT_599210 [Trametes elegans]|nr:hypothetical protein BD413DRAFT_599210 [Trametes elegans]